MGQSYTTQLLPGQRFGNYKLRSSAGVGFDVSERSVVVTFLRADISESGENEREALINLKSFISDLLDEHRANPKRDLGRRLNQQMIQLSEIFMYVG
ncbi:MAG: hypothetical protein KAV87_66285 [Desulfobacteraceae bacterium]|nr:hypothetical protein [Desulfobacteraceae bacterium]